MGSIPGWGTKIQHAMPHGQKKKNKPKEEEEESSRLEKTPSLGSAGAARPVALDPQVWYLQAEPRSLQGRRRCHEVSEKARRKGQGHLPVWTREQQTEGPSPPWMSWPLHAPKPQHNLGEGGAGTHPYMCREAPSANPEGPSGAGIREFCSGRENKGIFGTVWISENQRAANSLGRNCP